ncbi:MAG: dipeptidase PepE [Acidobacteriia bacterium]|nr:dipeptidase PepE [Terriglobia bacterium]
MTQAAYRLLLISNSALYGGGYLDHAEAEIRDLLGGRKGVLFVPYALGDWKIYAAKARERFEAMGYTLNSIHESANPQAAIESAEALFIGGGNTFRLLDRLYGFDVLECVRQRVGAGMPYLGASAGSNVACPTIRTTNDMPIVEPPSLKALGLVGFQINPHFLDPDPNSRHMGETREERIIQFLEENEMPVVGLREGAMLRVEQGRIQLKGSSGARIFRRGHDPVEVKPVADLSDYVS